MQSADFAVAALGTKTGVPAGLLTRARVASNRLKIVVSPVRVRVSPSAIPPVCGIFSFPVPFAARRSPSRIGDEEEMAGGNRAPRSAAFLRTRTDTSFRSGFERRRPRLPRRGRFGTCRASSMCRRGCARPAILEIARLDDVAGDYGSSDGAPATRSPNCRCARTSGRVATGDRTIATAAAAAHTDAVASSPNGRTPMTTRAPNAHEQTAASNESGPHLASRRPRAGPRARTRRSRGPHRPRTRSPRDATTAPPAVSQRPGSRTGSSGRRPHEVMQVDAAGLDTARPHETLRVSRALVLIARKESRKGTSTTTAAPGPGCRRSPRRSMSTSFTR